METASAEEVLASFPAFEQHVPEAYRYTADQLVTLQINIGYKCNLACKHCHLQCGPSRTEMMSREVMQACLDAYKVGGFSSVDITGGAPELHPDYPWLLEQFAQLGVRPMCRTNLCILTDPAYEHFAQLYADYDVQLVASMPAFVARKCDKIRGEGTFDANLVALRKLNELGFGTGEHSLTLVYNPAGAVLPGDQASMEAEFKQRLAADYGIHFDSLIAIANNPSGRFAKRLNEKGTLGHYMQKLIGAFNEATCPGMMCRTQISVDWQGKVYDCDFNQALGLEIETEQTIFDFAQAAPAKRHIVFGNHCYGCTAGAGSSCGGATA